MCSGFLKYLPAVQPAANPSFIGTERPSMYAYYAILKHGWTRFKGVFGGLIACNTRSDSQVRDTHLLWSAADPMWPSPVP